MRDMVGGKRVGARYVAPYAILVVAAIYCLFPVYWLVVAALKNTSQLVSGNGLLPPTHLSLLQNLAHVFTYEHDAYLSWVINTLLYSVVGGGVATLIAAAGGYAFAHYRFRGKSVYFFMIIGGVLLPPTALVIPLFLFFNRIGLANSIWAVLIPSVVSPLGLYLGRIYASAGVDRNLLDAGRIDGAGDLRIFVTIGLPLMRPALVTIFLFSFVSISNNFFLPLIMLDREKLYPITLGLYTWSSSLGSTATPRFVEAAVVTGALIAVVPVVVAFLLLQRWWTRAIGLGALKG